MGKASVATFIYPIAMLLGSNSFYGANNISTSLGKIILHFSLLFIFYFPVGRYSIVGILSYYYLIKS